MQLKTSAFLVEYMTSEIDETGFSDPALQSYKSEENSNKTKVKYSVPDFIKGPYKRSTWLYAVSIFSVIILSAGFYIFIPKYEKTIDLKDFFNFDKLPEWQISDNSLKKEIDEIALKSSSNSAKTRNELTRKINSEVTILRESLNRKLYAEISLLEKRTTKKISNLQTSLRTQNIAISNIANDLEELDIELKKALDDLSKELKKINISKSERASIKSYESLKKKLEKLEKSIKNLGSLRANSQSTKTVVEVNNAHNWKLRSAARGIAVIERKGNGQRLRVSLGTVIPGCGKVLKIETKMKRVSSARCTDIGVK